MQHPPQNLPTRANSLVKALPPVMWRLWYCRPDFVCPHARVHMWVKWNALNNFRVISVWKEGLCPSVRMRTKWSDGESMRVCFWDVCFSVMCV